MHMPFILAGIFNEFGLIQLALLLVVGVIVFGKRLPEVGKNLGRSIVEFKKGMASAGDALTETTSVEQPKYITAQATPVAPPPAPTALPNTEDALRRQEQELQRLQTELKQLREQLAKTSPNPDQPKSF